MITLTPDQQQLLDEIKEWLSLEMSDIKSSRDHFRTLAGFAGTGKTTLLDFVVKEAKAQGLSVAVTATTNKAVKVLTEKVKANNYMTIHSALGIKAKRRGTIEIFEPDNYNDSSLTNFDLVIIDEASMISSEENASGTASLLTLIVDQVLDTETRVLFCGDPAQLQPINETISKCFKYPGGKLTTIVRHDDGISKVAEQLRMQTSFVSVENLISPPDVTRLSINEAKELFKDWRENPDSVRALAWRNVTVDKWNRIFRQADYGKSDLERFQAGDIIIANEPCFRTETDGTEHPLMRNSQEGRVLSAKLANGGKYWKLKVETLDTKKKVTLNVISKDYEKKFQAHLRGLAASKEWDKFWKKKKFFHDIKHAYAMTIHKSQGSTFDNIIVDVADCYINRDNQNRNQLLYVGITRAAEKVFLMI